MNKDTRTSSYIVKLKIAAVVIGNVDVALTLDSYYRFRHMDDEKFFLFTIVTALILSTVICLSMKLDFLAKYLSASTRKLIDVVYHGLMGILICIGAVLFTINSTKYKGVTFTFSLIATPTEKPVPFTDDNYVERMFASVRDSLTSFGFLNAVVHGSICVMGACGRR